MKTNMIAKLALNSDIDYVVKCNIVKYINKNFKGDISHLSKNSSIVSNLTLTKGKQNAN